MYVSDEELVQYERDGYYVARGLFSREEVIHLRDHLMRLREAGSYPGDVIGVDPKENDPLKRYPVMHHPHRWDTLTRSYMLDERNRQVMTRLLGSEPLACQSMVYFKPPGARGQALHQDQYYLRVQPGTCMAAWMTLDYVDQDNGCLEIVPGSHKLPTLCVIDADITKSITPVTVPLAEGMEAVPIVMEPGDVLYFNGQVIHGSGPNITKDRFRRVITCHYVEGAAEKVTQYDHPVLCFDGTIVEDFGVSDTGGQCGVWVDESDRQRIEMKIEPGNPEYEAYIKERNAMMRAEAEKIRQALAQ
jgi:phytanoyl-CoA hydroxylase